MPLKSISEPKIVKDNVRNPIKDKVPIIGRSIQGSWRVGSFNDWDGKNPENIKTSKIRITDPKNIRLPPALIMVSIDSLDWLTFCQRVKQRLSVINIVNKNKRHEKRITIWIH